MQLYLTYIDDIIAGRDDKLMSCPDCGRILDTKRDQHVHLRLKSCVKSRCKICRRDLLHHRCPELHFMESFCIKRHIKHRFLLMTGKSTKSRGRDVSAFGDSNRNRYGIPHCIVEHGPLSNWYHYIDR